MSAPIRWWISSRSSARSPTGWSRWRGSARSRSISICRKRRWLIAGDREELLRLFENLIENALKYGASGGKVVVSLISALSGEGAPEVRVMVRDFGPGIAPEHLPRLTERFYRVDVGDSRAQGGTGLGLSLVKHIVNRHRGRLLIESVPEKGRHLYRLFSPGQDLRLTAHKVKRFQVA